MYICSIGKLNEESMSNGIVNGYELAPGMMNTTNG